MDNNTNTNKNHENAFNVYCNGIQVAASPFDFTLILNNNSPLGEKFIGEIKMSPEHAKVFANILMENVRNYEEMFGAIPQLDPVKLQMMQDEGKITVEGKDKWV